jgi:hypothetical protein
MERQDQHVRVAIETQQQRADAGVVHRIERAPHFGGDHPGGQATARGRRHGGEIVERQGHRCGRADDLHRSVPAQGEPGAQGLVTRQ